MDKETLRREHREYMRAYTQKRIAADPEWHARYKAYQKEQYRKNRQARIAATAAHKKKKREDPEQLAAMRATDAARARMRRATDPAHRDKLKAYNRKWTRERTKTDPVFKAKRLADALRRQRERRDWTDSIKVARGGCSCCDENDPKCLDFHHRDSAEKEFTIASCLSRSKDRLLKEIEKCDVLCANCHRKEGCGEPAKAHQRVRRAWLWSIKSEQGCKHCDEADPRCLDFHHRDPANKEFTIGNHNSRSKDKLLKEMAKCDVSCANCHRKLTHDDPPIPVAHPQDC